jgi:hypothetical protein
MPSYGIKVVLELIKGGQGKSQGGTPNKLGGNMFRPMSQYSKQDTVHTRSDDRHSYLHMPVLTNTAQVGTLP